MAIKPGKYNPLKPDIELFDYKSKKRYGLKLDGSGALQIGTISQDDTVHIRTAGKKIGDFDEQRSWKGGRGIENLSDNDSGFWDSYNAWTLTEGHVHQTPLWEFAKGLRTSQYFMPDTTHSMSWMQLFSTTRYVDIPVTSLFTFSADYARMWIQRVGTPGTLTFELRADVAGLPNGSVLQTVTVTTSNITDVLSVLYKLNWTSTQSVTSGTKYHLLVYGASTDNKTNHWKIGGYSGGSTGLYSSAGVTWNTMAFEAYYFLADADTDRKFFSFTLDEAFYVVDKKTSNAVSQLYINGDRGVATASTTAALNDTAKSWTADKWVGAYVKIVRGTGSGQVRIVSTNTSSAITPTIAWSVAPDTTSEYIIYNTPWFTEITGAGFGIVTSVCVANRIVYFAQNGASARHMIFNATTHAHEFGAQTGNGMTFMITVSDTNGVRLYGMLIGNVLQYAAAQAYTTTPAILTFTSIKAIGDSAKNVTNMVEKDGLIYVFKEDGIWNASPNGTIARLQSAMEKTPSYANGQAAIVHQQFLYYSWLHSVIRVYGSSHDDVGQDWSGWGLPNGREGVFSSFDTYTSLLIATVDAGTAGTSSVLGFDGLGWHELLRGYDVGIRSRFAKVQVVPEARNFMWVEFGGDLVFQKMPYLKGSPRLDSGMRYMHEAVIESSAIDMGTASALPKFIKELTVYCQNLGTSNRIEIDYQTDDDVHTTNWTPATTLYESPEATAFLGLSNVRKFAYRLRIQSEDNTAPVDVLGVIPNGYARVPYKMVWTLRCKADNITSRGRIVKPDILMRWLLDNARYPGRIEMQSQYELAHKFFVIIHPPRMFPYKPAQNGQAEESAFTIVLEEA